MNQTGASPEPIRSRARWKRSTRCSSGTCVEVLLTSSDTILIRDSKLLGANIDQKIISMSTGEFSMFLTVIGREAKSRSGCPIDLVELSNGDTVFRSRSTGVELRFDQDEIDAFVAGIRAGEFTPEALMQPVG